ncbi:hypothetical protein LCGC14_1859580 [marine sediment metagenome]|uniref:Uncharacterized protein n=1 Tax=marine sediment metagenome TaxID=412755 RepID=A0A0F9G5H1_9ZZZZ
MEILRLLIQHYYERHPTGGVLHIVLDDLNAGDGHIEGCLHDMDGHWWRGLHVNDDCLPWCDSEARLIAGLLLQILDEEQRVRLIGEATGHDVEASDASP